MPRKISYTFFSFSMNYFGVKLFSEEDSMSNDGYMIIAIKL